MANTRTVGSGKQHSTIGSALSWFQSNHDFDTDGIGTISIEDNAEYNENLDITGIAGTATITAYLKITVAVANRHAGVAGTGHARVRGSTNGSHVFQLTKDFTFLEYLEIQQDSTGSSDEGIRITADTDDVLISRCIIWTDSNATDTDGIYAPDVRMIAAVDNCIIYGFNRGGIHAQNFSGSATQDWNVDFCTIYDCGEGNTDEGGIVITNPSGTVNMTVFNTACLEGDPTDFRDPSSDGTWAGTNNASTDASLTAIGLTTGAQESLTLTATTQSSGSFFVVNSLTGGSEDLTLLDGAAGNLAFENGVNRVGSEPDVRQDFSLDIAGNARSTTSPSPDIGASEFTAAGGGVTVNLTGQLSTFSQGALTVTGAASVSLTGQSATFSQGAITVDISAAVTVNLAGQAATFSQGSLAVTGEALVSLSGQQITANQGTIAVSVGGAVNVILSGQQIASSQGTITATGKALVNLAGQEITSGQGTITVSIVTAPTVINLSGQAIALNIGIIGLQTANVISLTGQSITLTQGSLTVTGDLPSVPDADGLTVSGNFGVGISITSSFGTGATVKGKL